MRSCRAACDFPSVPPPHSRMKRGRERPPTEYRIPRESEQERRRIEAGEGISASQSRVIQETTQRRPDGSQSLSASQVLVHDTSQPRVSAPVAAPAPITASPLGLGEDEPVYDITEQVFEDARQLRESDDPLRQWVEDYRHIYLKELLRREGRNNHAEYSICRLCGARESTMRCKDCYDGGGMWCGECIVATHKHLPFHRIQHWNGSHFTSRSLKSLGVRIQLGHWHELHHFCPNPIAASGDDFVIIDDHGVHEIGLDFCGCSRSGLPVVQLLRAGLFPATTTNPRTAATFNVLRRYHLMSFEATCSAYEFYHSIARETNNGGASETAKMSRETKADSGNSNSGASENSRDRYDEFLRMTKEWRHLQMLKRTGRGHDPAGIANTKPGECALLCPACPQPGKNLPENWKDYPEEKEFLFALFLAIDANFRLKRKDISSEAKDPGLGQGWAFYCNVLEYMAHVRTHWDRRQERSRCVAHDAVDKPDREARGTASSGVATVDCARHNMKRPNSVGDLQLGERYINSDFVFFKGIAGSELIRFFVSYDIACQWHVHLWERMAQYENEELYVDGQGKFFVFLIPKFHLPAHIEECNLLFSFNLTPFTGMTDGEAPERGWAATNPLAGSTMNMGPGSRRDALDDFFNDQNHKKIVRLGRVMLDKVQEAVPLMVDTWKALVDLESSFDPQTLADWERMARLWEKDARKPNPFECVNKDKHLAQVRRELAEEAAQRETAGLESTGAIRADMHVTELIAMGLQLEEQQRVLRADTTAMGLHPSDRQRAAMTERGSKLRRKIFAWTEIQALFWPIAERLRAEEDEVRARTAASQGVPGLKVYEISLWLPSALKRRPGARGDDGCSDEILLHEYRLRVGQANEALDEMRRNLLVRSHLYALKDRYARGVKHNTRSKTKIDGVEERIRRAAEQYRIAYAALRVLGEKLHRDEWSRALKVLVADDIRGMPRTELGDVSRRLRKSKKPTGRRSMMMGEAPPVPESAGVEEEDEHRIMGKKRKTGDKRPPRPLSWIWLSSVQGDGAKQAGEALRIEWAKTRARSKRWSEEVDLLEEEMRRILQFLTWQANWWEGLAQRPAEMESCEAEGERAYALRQAALKQQLRDAFSRMWANGQLSKLIQSGRAEKENLRMALTDMAGDDANAAAVADASGDEDTADEGEDPIPPRPPGAAVIHDS